MGHFLLLLPIHPLCRIMHSTAAGVCVSEIMLLWCWCCSTAEPRDSQPERQPDRHRIVIITIIIWWQWMAVVLVVVVFYQICLRLQNNELSQKRWICELAVCVCVGGWARRIFWAKCGGCSNKQWILIIIIRTNHPPYTPWPTATALNACNTIIALIKIIARSHGKGDNADCLNGGQSFPQSASSSGKGWLYAATGSTTTKPTALESSQHFVDPSVYLPQPRMSP